MLQKNKKILFVSKDMGGANVSIPLIKLAQKSGYSVEIVAEGLAVSKYEESRLKPYSSEGHLNSDAKKVIEKLKPEIVITTLGVPINLEQDYGLAANDLGIPLVFLEDYWGAHVRSQAAPDLILSIDEKAAEIARSRFNSAAKVVTIGNYAVNNALSLEIPDGVRETIKGLRNRFGPVLLFTAGGVHVSDQILLLAACLKNTPNWVLVPRFHPKSVNLIGPSGKTFGEEWQGLLKEFGEKVVYLQSEPIGPLVALADATLSDFSTLLTIALASGRSAVSIATAGVRETMKNETSFTSHPLVETGLVKEITRPCDLTGYLARPDSEAIAQYLQPYEPEKALQAIEGL